MIVAIIGAGGFLGGYLSRHFQESGAEIIAVSPTTPLPDRPLDVVVDCNGDARRFWANENPDESFRVNVLSTEKRIAELKYEKYVYLSTIDVYGPAQSDPGRNNEDSPIPVDALDTYGLHKHLAEEAVRAEAPHYLILRAGTLLGPGLKKNPVFDALNGSPIRQTPDSTLSLITVEKFAKALDRLLQAGAEGTYNVTANASIDVATMLRCVAEALGCDADDYSFHDELLTTKYDISVVKMSQHMVLSNSQTMLTEYLSGLR